MWRRTFGCTVLLFLLIYSAKVCAQTDNPYILNGNASKENCNCYTLTQDRTFLSGSVWNINKIDLNEPFDYNFNVFLGCNDAQGADGIAFVLQPISTSIGTSGGGMGYEGVSPSVGVIIDTWQNVEDNDPAADHLAIHKNGIIDHSPANDLAGPVSALSSNGNIEDCKWHTLRITWDPGSHKLSAVIDGFYQHVEAVVDLVAEIFNGDPMVYWGFTAATGSATNHQRVCTSLNPGFTFPENTETCFPATIAFADSSASFGTIEKWFWDFGDGTRFEGNNPPPHSFTAPGNYDVKLSILGNNGCVSDNFVKTVVVGSDPVAAFSYFPGQVCAGMPVTFADSSKVQFGTITSWSWKIAGQEFEGQSPPPVVLPSKQNRIELNVATREGCESQVLVDTVEVKSLPCPEFYVPSAFSPNNDGVNDSFMFVAAGMQSIESFQIFNRYGQRIYSSTDLKTGWDGRFKGFEQPSGIYVWQIRGTDLNGQVHSKKGTVMLVR